MSMHLAIMFGAVAAAAMVAILSFEFGRRSGGVYRVYKHRPKTFVQFDPAMSEGAMVEFLEQVAERIRTEGLVEAEDGKDGRADD